MGGGDHCMINTAPEAGATRDNAAKASLNSLEETISTCPGATEGAVTTPTILRLFLCF